MNENMMTSITLLCKNSWTDTYRLVSGIYKKMIPRDNTINYYSTGNVNTINPNMYYTIELLKRGVNIYWSLGSWHIYMDIYNQRVKWIQGNTAVLLRTLSDLCCFCVVLQRICTRFSYFICSAWFASIGHPPTILPGRLVLIIHTTKCRRH